MYSIWPAWDLNFMPPTPETNVLNLGLVYHTAEVLFIPILLKKLIAPKTLKASFKK